jgi:hypothetical protein
VSSTRSPARARGHDVASSVLTVATAVLATVGLGAVLPGAASSWSAATADRTRPVAVRLEGVLVIPSPSQESEAGRLELHNDSAEAVRWTIDPTGDRSPGSVADVEAWVATDQPCGSRGVLLEPGRWSAIPLAPGATVALCAQVLVAGADGRAGSEPPGLSVHARAA